MLNPLHEHGDGAGIDGAILLRLIDHQLLACLGMAGQGQHLIVTPLEVSIAAGCGCMHEIPLQMEQDGKGEICAGQCQLYQLFLVGNDDEEAFLHKPIVPESVKISTQ